MTCRARGCAGWNQKFVAEFPLLSEEARREVPLYRCSYSVWSNVQLGFAIPRQNACPRESGFQLFSNLLILLDISLLSMGLA